MIHMSARPKHGADIFVGDRDEPAEVRWVSPSDADAEELMQPYGTFRPVRDYLAKALQ